MAGILQLILVIIIVALIFYVLLKVLKSVLKAVSSIILILLIITTVFGTLVYLDFKDFKNNIGEEKSLLALQSGDEILLTVEILPSGFKSDKNLFTKAQNSTIQEKLEDKNYDFNNYYKAIILKEEVLKEGLPREIEPPWDLDKKISRKQYLQLLHSDTPKKDFAGHMGIEPARLDSKINNSELKDFKSMLLGYGIQQVIKEKGRMYFINKFREKQIQMRPRSLSLRLFRMVPTSMLKSALNTTA